jgi:hypothetical protein
LEALRHLSYDENGVHAWSDANELVVMNFDIEHLRHLLTSFGYWGGHFAVWAIVFAESGLLVGQGNCT